MSGPEKSTSPWFDMATAPQDREILLLCGDARIPGSWDAVAIIPDIERLSLSLYEAEATPTKRGRWASTADDSSWGTVLPCEPRAWAELPDLPEEGAKGWRYETRIADGARIGAENLADLLIEAAKRMPRDRPLFVSGGDLGEGRWLMSAWYGSEFKFFGADIGEEPAIGVEGYWREGRWHVDSDEAKPKVCAVKPADG